MRISVPPGIHPRRAPRPGGVAAGRRGRPHGAPCTPAPAAERAPGRVVLRLAAPAGAHRQLAALRDPDRGRGLQPRAGRRLLVDLRQRPDARAPARARRAGGRGRVHPRLQRAGRGGRGDRHRGGRDHRSPRDRDDPRRRPPRGDADARRPARGRLPAPARAVRRQGGEHQSRARPYLGALRRDLRLRPRARPGVPRAHARPPRRPRGGVRADPPVLRERRARRGRGRLVVAAGALLRRDRDGQARRRRRSSAAVPTSSSGAAPSRSRAASPRTP